MFIPFANFSRPIISSLTRARKDTFLCEKRNCSVTTERMTYISRFRIFLNFLNQGVKKRVRVTQNSHQWGQILLTRFPLLMNCMIFTCVIAFPLLSRMSCKLQEPLKSYTRILASFFAFLVYTTFWLTRIRFTSFNLRPKN